MQLEEKYIQIPGLGRKNPSQSAGYWYFAYKHVVYKTQLLWNNSKTTGFVKYTLLKIKFLRCWKRFATWYLKKSIYKSHDYIGRKNPSESATVEGSNEEDSYYYVWVRCWTYCLLVESQQRCYFKLSPSDCLETVIIIPRSLVWLVTVHDCCQRNSFW